MTIDRGVPRTAAPALAAFVLLAAVAPARAAAPAEERPWTEIHTAHFTVLSSAPERRTFDIVRRLERYKQTLSTVFSRIKVEPAVETIVYIFNDDNAMTPFRKRHQGRAVELVGYFLARRDANYVIINGGGQGDPLRTVYHEMMHEFEALYLPPLPPWFSEGLAECYETFRADGRTADIGVVHEEHVELLRRLPIMPLGELFAVTHDSTDYNEGDRRGVFYAESWALVHYLMWDKPERREQLVRFLGGLGQGRSPKEAFAAAFDVSIGALEAELKRQIQQTRFHQTTAVFKEEMVFDTTARTRALARGEAEARLGDLLAHLGEEFGAGAEALLQKSLVHSPGNALASRSLGLLRLDQGRVSDAVALFEAALAADPQDVVAALHLAEVLLGPGAGRPASADQSDAAEPPDDRARARDLLARAVKTRPEFGEAAVAYSRSLLVEPGAIKAADLGAAIAALEKARERLPYRHDAAANLAILYAIQGEFERAREIVVRVLPGLGYPDAVESTRNMVNFYRRRAELKAQRTSAAAPSGEEGPDSSGTFPPLPEDAEARRLVVAIQPPAHSEYDEVVLFNRAATLGNDGNYRDAIRALAWLLMMTRSEEMQDRTRGLIVLMKSDAARHDVPID